METPSPKADELLEKPFLTFVIYHTKSLTEALEYLTIKTLYSLKVRRKKFDIATPPKGNYTGPKLTQEEMVFSFLASQATEPLVLSPELIRQCLHSVVITIGMTGVQTRIYPLSQLMGAPLASQPVTNAARLAR
jgi:hypothetical protein